jgi:CDP-diacylglycerol--serine O-phosphatidyltransferase
MTASFAFGIGWVEQPYVVGPVMVAVAGLMVSRIPTFSFKRLRVPPRSVLPTMLGIGLLIVLVISIPWVTFLGIAGAYLLSIPVSMLSYRRLAQRRPVAEPVDTTGAMR